MDANEHELGEADSTHRREHFLSSPIHVYSRPFAVKSGFNKSLLLDTSSLEVFAQNGETVLTHIILPAAGPRRFSIDAGEGPLPSAVSITIHVLKSARQPIRP